MDMVLTLNDWWDGPLLGIATFGCQTCIYERFFSADQDSYLNRYYLTPISNKLKKQIMGNWEEWLQWMALDHSSKRIKQWIDSDKYLNLKSIAKHSPNYHQYVKQAEFVGERPWDLYSPLKRYYVIWK